MSRYLAAMLAVTTMAAAPAAAQTVYLNQANTTVSLGPTMSANPFSNRGTAESLASIVDAPSAGASEFHNQSTHVWVSGGPLELLFDFGIAYDLTTLHFWNYHSEGFDVDNIDFRFYDAQNALVGSLLNFAPALGGSAPSDATPIFAEHYALSFPTNVRYVNALLTGSNGQVDFNNLGFTGAVAAAPSVVPEPTTVVLLAAGLAVMACLRRRRQHA